MAHKDPNDPRIKEARNRHYANNKQVYKDRANEKRLSLQKLIQSLKNVPCMDCEIKYPYYVMEFDHRDPSQKLWAVGHLPSCGSERLIREEVAKCDVVCSNCHRERTHGGTR